MMSRPMSWKNSKVDFSMGEFWQGTWAGNGLRHAQASSDDRACRSMETKA